MPFPAIEQEVFDRIDLGVLNRQAEAVLVLARVSQMSFECAGCFQVGDGTPPRFGLVADNSAGERRQTDHATGNLAVATQIARRQILGKYLGADIQAGGVILMRDRQFRIDRVAHGTDARKA